MIFGIIFSSFSTTPDIPKTTTTASCADAILNTNGGNVNIEINWEPNTIPLHWYDGNTELTVPVESQSCVYAGALTPPPPPPAREGYTFRGWKVRGVPDGYTKLEYVSNTAITYLNTGIVPDVDDIEMEFKVQPTLSSWSIWQNKVKCGSARVGISGSMTGDTINFRLMEEAITSAIIRTSGHIYIVKGIAKSGNGTIYVKDLTTNEEDTKTRAYSSSLSGQTLPLWLFGNQDDQRVHSGNQVYYARMKKAGVLVMNYIPVKRNSDNAVGFYDTVSKSFKMVNQGSLIAGPDAQ